VHGRVGQIRRRPDPTRRLISNRVDQEPPDSRAASELRHIHEVQEIRTEEHPASDDGVAYDPLVTYRDSKPTRLGRFP